MGVRPSYLCDEEVTVNNKSGEIAEGIAKMGETKKIVPDDLVLTPSSVAAWFEGAGSATWDRRRPNLVILTLNTSQFGHAGTSRLRELLIRDVGVKMSICHAKWRGEDDWHLATYNTGEINRFFDAVEPYIQLPFRHKIKRPWRRALDTMDTDGGPRRLKGPFVWKDGDWVRGEPPQTG